MGVEGCRGTGISSNQIINSCRQGQNLYFSYILLHSYTSPISYHSFIQQVFPEHAKKQIKIFTLVELTFLEPGVGGTGQVIDRISK